MGIGESFYGVLRKQESIQLCTFGPDITHLKAAGRAQ